MVKVETSFQNDRFPLKTGRVDWGGAVYRAQVANLMFVSVRFEMLAFSFTDIDQNRSNGTTGSVGEYG